MEKKSLFNRILCSAVIAGTSLAAIAAEDVISITENKDAVAPQAITTLCGLKVYDDAWADTSVPINSGAYTIQAIPGGEIKQIKQISSVMGARAAVCVNNTMYVLRRNADYSVTYSKYSTSSWNASGTAEETDEVNLPTDLTYDPVTGKVYGFFYDAENDYYSRFASFSIYSAEASDILNGERDGWAIAADGHGKIYCLYGAYNYLATVDPKTGQVDRIKTTGLSPIDINCMVYDQMNDRLLAVITTNVSRDEWTSALWEINPVTAETVKIMDMPGNASFIGLYTLPFTPEFSAPDAVSKVNHTALSASSASFTFSVPSVSVDGSALTSAVSVDIKANGQSHVFTGLMPGTRVQTGEITVGEGEQSVSFTAFNDSGLGNSTSITIDCTPEPPKPTTTFTVPWTEEFPSQEAFDYWRVENSNGGSTWSWDSRDKAAIYKYDENKLVADDWLFSPAFDLKAGHTYRLSYSPKVYNKKYDESFDIGISTDTNSTSLLKTLARHENIVNTAYDPQHITFSVEADGTYHVAIHCFSDPYKWILYLDNISMEEVDSRVPAAVEDFKAVAGEKGTLTCTLSFKAPVLDAEGGDLHEISTIRVYRNGVEAPVHSFTGVNPGENLEWTDTGFDGKSQLYTYRVVCANAAGDGQEARTEVYVGIDAPGQVPALTLTENTEGKPQLSWQRPTESANGGWFDTSDITYRIVRSDGVAVVDGSLRETSYVDESYEAPVSKQDAVYYLVYAISGGLRSPYAMTDLVLFGKPYEAPLTENFPDAGMTWYPWVTHTDGSLTSAWTFDVAGYDPAASDFSGDKGLATFHSAGQQPGGKSLIYSPKVSLKELSSPELAMRVYHSAADSPETNESLEICVQTPEGDVLPLEGASVIRRDEGAAAGWILHTASLAPVKDQPWVRIVLVGTTAGGKDMYIDNFSIRESAATDLEITGVNHPSRIATGETVRIETSVSNVGNLPVSSASLDLINSDAVVEKAMVPSLAPGESATVIHNVTLSAVSTANFKLRLNVEGDSDESNNVAEITISAVEPVLPSAGNLQARVENGRVSLFWTPATDVAAVNDDCESYEDFAIANIGEYTVEDRDLSPTYYINNGVDYPHASDPKAWQVCNARTLGIDIWDEGTPRSGNKMLMAMASTNYVNDDWLISPRLNGAEQYISFYAKAFTDQNVAPERMRVLTSTTDADPANFTPVHSSDYIEVPARWTLYRYHIPAGVRYFAINCVSDDAFALFVDDLSYNDMSVPSSLEAPVYEVYRDNCHISTVSEPLFIDHDPGEGKVTYRVRTLYGERAAGFTNEVTVQTSVIDNPLYESPVIVRTGIYTLTGVRLDCGVENLLPGFYIIDGRKTLIH